MAACMCVDRTRGVNKIACNMIEKETLQSVLQAYSISACEYWIMHVLWHSTMPPHVVTAQALAYSDRDREKKSGYGFQEANTSEDLERALQGLLIRDYLWILQQKDIPLLNEMVLFDQPHESPLVGYFCPSELEFTKSGATIVLDVFRRSHNWSEETAHAVSRKDVSDDEYYEYTSSLDFLFDAMCDEQCVVIGRPVRIGSWRDRWWREYPRGWRVRIRQV
jgi:hypothetical protein